MTSYSDMLSLDTLTSIFDTFSRRKKKGMSSEYETGGVAGMPLSDSGSPQNPEVVNGWQHLTEPHPFAEQAANWQPTKPFTSEEEAYWNTMFEPADQGWTPYNQSFSTVEEAQLWEAKNPAPAPKPKPIGSPSQGNVDYELMAANYNMMFGYEEDSEKNRANWSRPAVAGSSYRSGGGGLYWDHIWSGKMAPSFYKNNPRWKEGIYGKG